MRHQWCVDNPDIVTFLHALRTELLVRLVMPALVPHSSAKPFQYWVRFEEGFSGNPHAHGLSMWTAILPWMMSGTLLRDYYPSVALI